MSDLNQREYCALHRLPLKRRSIETGRVLDNAIAAIGLSC
jgi:hypothetical protein